MQRSIPTLVWHQLSLQSFFTESKRSVTELSTVIVGVLIRKISKAEEGYKTKAIALRFRDEFCFYIPPASESSLNFDDLQLAY